MHLPVVLDVTIGLIFIYLTASLLASEIQELISTLLQWRAKHLKESIHNLLAGGQGTIRDEQLGEFVETIYNDPLIKNLNQSARGWIGLIGQWFYRNVLYRRHSIFGKQTTAPSYINAETFATVLLEQIGMGKLLGKLTEIRLERFVGRIIGQFDLQKLDKQSTSIPDDHNFQNKAYRQKGSIRVLAEKAKSLSQGKLGVIANSILILNQSPDYQDLVEEYCDLLRDFKASEAELETCVERMKEGLDVYIHQIAAHISAADSSLSDLEHQQLNYFYKRLTVLRTSTFGEKLERAIVSGRLKPTLLEIAEVFDHTSATYQEIEAAYQDIAAAYEANVVTQQVKTILNAMNQQLDKLRKADRSSLSKLPLKTLPDVPLQFSDLIEPRYQLALNELAQQLRPDDRKIYRNWQLYQQTFSQILQKIAIYLQQKGELVNHGIKLTRSIDQLDPKMLRSSVIESLSQLQNNPNFDLDKYVLTQLDATERSTYKGWQTYQQIILNVVRELADQLQTENKFFSDRARKPFKQYPKLEDADLYLAVKYSLALMSQEERQLHINMAVKKLLTEDQQIIFSIYQTYEQIQDLLAGVPPSVKQSLAILARRAQIKAEYAKDQLEQFNTEVACWFDRSMSRASGVYKRNAKGVAIVLGLFIAIVANADTLHIIMRLSGDDNLRQIITNRVSTIMQSATREDLDSPDKLRQLKQNTNAVLREISLPISWTPENLSQQFNCPSVKAPTIDPTLSPWRSFYQSCLNQNDAPERFEPLLISQIATRPQNLFGSSRMLIGWLITGIAIAMGAPFWFDVLSKIMNVRNTGTKPAAIADQEPSQAEGGRKE